MTIADLANSEWWTFDRMVIAFMLWWLVAISLHLAGKP